MGEMKAIQTEYKGYLFRSRLEARWAVFFDACGVDWEYEPEGYVSRRSPPQTCCTASPSACSLTCPRQTGSIYKYQIDFRRDKR